MPYNRRYGPQKNGGAVGSAGPAQGGPGAANHISIKIGPIAFAYFFLFFILHTVALRTCPIDHSFVLPTAWVQTKITIRLLSIRRLSISMSLPSEGEVEAGMKRLSWMKNFTLDNRTTALKENTKSKRSPGCKKCRPLALRPKKQHF
jgi:hypothetical protein